MKGLNTGRIGRFYRSASIALNPNKRRRIIRAENFVEGSLSKEERLARGKVALNRYVQEGKSTLFGKMPANRRGVRQNAKLIARLSPSKIKEILKEPNSHTEIEQRLAFGYLLLAETPAGREALAREWKAQRAASAARVNPRAREVVRRV